MIWSTNLGLRSSMPISNMKRMNVINDTTSICFVTVVIYTGLPFVQIEKLGICTRKSDSLCINYFITSVEAR